GGRVREIVQRQHDYVVADADASVFAPPGADGDARALRPTVRLLCRLLRSLRHGYHRLVLRLWTCTCSPFLMLEPALPISWPYFHTVSPFLMSESAILWPIGTSMRDFILNEELSAVMTQSISVPAFNPSMTTTPTVSFLS